jgi:16S rRNA A1518/A1519 N6-dimethyltransferase RsmA/KsgA/DIM1 with predicted DNA glycosylase/AP lyase activity
MGILFWLVAALVGCFGLGAMLGAPFLPIRRPDLEAALDLAEVTAGQTVIDLGSGDGRLLLAAAKRGASAIGYEINPLLVVWSRAVTWRYRRLVTIHLADFWRAQLPDADVIYTFLLTRYTKRLDRKLAAETRRPTKLISYVFELPRPPLKQTRNTFLYQYP